MNTTPEASPIPVAAPAGPEGLDSSATRRALDLATLTAVLWSEGGTVPYAIASAIVVEACNVLATLPSASCLVALEHLSIDTSGRIALGTAAHAPSVCEPMVDLGVVAWELFAGRRFSLQDVLPGGDVPSLVSICAREGRSTGSLERRMLSEIDPLVRRATALDPAQRHASFLSFARAMDATVRPSSMLRVAAWFSSMTGPRLRAPLVTPSPPKVRFGAPAPVRRIDGFDALDMLADLALVMPPARSKTA